MGGQGLQFDLTRQEAPQDWLDKSILAIDAQSAVHGAYACVNAADGLDIFTPDGRDLSVCYDASVTGLSWMSFGLGTAAVAQRVDLSIQENRPAYPQVTQTPDCVEFDGY